MTDDIKSMPKIIEDGGSAFPIPGGRRQIGGAMMQDPTTPGITARDYFAAAALTGILSASNSHCKNGEELKDGEDVVELAYGYADEMIEQRKK